ncbi:MAG: protein kinase, partial [Candidatus Obscuribacterales bacterium]|nr:protein kinase [Candidatus Obscuribacterales bacterium]
GDAQNLTKTGNVLGSPKYMSPEQCDNQKLDCRSDIYSISCVMYEALSGEPVFTGSSAFDVMHKHSRQAPPTVPEFSRKTQLGEELSKVIVAGLSKEPDSRPQSAEELSAKLISILEMLPQDKEPKIRQSGKGIFADKHMRLLIGCFTALLLAYIAVLVSLRSPFSINNSKSISNDASYSIKNKITPVLTLLNEASKARENGDYKASRDKLIVAERSIDAEAPKSKRIGKIQQEEWLNKKYRVHTELGLSLETCQQYALAAEQYAKAVKVFPSGEKYRRASLEAAFNLGKAGKTAESDELFKSLASNVSKTYHAEPSQEEAGIYFRQGQLQKDSNRLEEALKSFEKCLNIQDKLSVGRSTDTAVQCTLGYFEIAKKLHKGKQAQEQVERTKNDLLTVNNPVGRNSVIALISFARFAKAQGWKATAIQMFQTCIKVGVPLYDEDTQVRVKECRAELAKLNAKAE